MKPEEHWDRVYQKGASTQFSWFEEVPTVSLRLIEAAGLSPSTRIIDAGALSNRSNTRASRGADRRLQSSRCQPSTRG